MPELPDVKVFKRYLDSSALHQTIARVSVENRKVLHGISSQVLG
jgi:formamidopyrimidine-DNA glycosylase